MTKFSPHRRRGSDEAVERYSKIQPWLIGVFVAAISLLIGIGIYVGLHSLVFGPDY